MFGIFTLAIKFDCLFLGIFQSFQWFAIFIFSKLAPSLNICFKISFKSLFGPFHHKKQSPKSKKRGIFLILHFGWQANGGSPVGYATENTIKLLKYFFIERLIIVIEHSVGFRWH